MGSRPRRTGRWDSGEPDESAPAGEAARRTVIGLRNGMRLEPPRAAEPS